MKIKVLMTDKAMQRPVMDDRERMLSAGSFTENRDLGGLHQERTG